jgi:hypothetical protein
LEASCQHAVAGSALCEGIAAIEGFFVVGKPPAPPLHNMTHCWAREEEGAWHSSSIRPRG